VSNDNSLTVKVIEKRDYRLYDVAEQRFVGRADLADMILSGRKYVILDSETGEDVTKTARPL
jgi:polyhydroxyalkanoate synthesis regulator protein